MVEFVLCLGAQKQAGTVRLSAVRLGGMHGGGVGWGRGSDCCVCSLFCGRVSGLALSWKDSKGTLVKVNAACSPFLC